MVKRTFMTGTILLFFLIASFVSFGFWQGSQKYFIEEYAPLSAPLDYVEPTPGQAPPKRNALTLTPEISYEFLLLQDAIQQEINNYSFTAAVAVTDLQTGETLSVNGDELLFPGCTINLLVLIATVQDLEAGVYPEPEVGNLIQTTITYSNAYTAFLLLEKLGNGDPAAGLLRIEQLIKELNLQSALYDHAPGYGYIASLYGGRNNYVSVLDMNKLLTMLYRDEILSNGWSYYLLEKMTHVKIGLNYLIPAGVGEEAIVAHKNGFFPYYGGFVDNDVGIVFFIKEGRQYAYAISFFSQEVPVKYTDEIVLGQTVSRMVWEYFDGKYN